MEADTPTPQYIRTELYLKVTYQCIRLEDRGGTNYDRTYCVSTHITNNPSGSLCVEYYPLDSGLNKDDFGPNDLVDLSNPKLEKYQKPEKRELPNTKQCHNYLVITRYNICEVQLVRDCHLRDLLN